MARVFPLAGPEGEEVRARWRSGRTAATILPMQHGAGTWDWVLVWEFVLLLQLPHTSRPTQAKPRSAALKTA
jgi:hypothetical protein